MDECERLDALETIIRTAEQTRTLARRNGHELIAGLLDAVVNQARADQLRIAAAASPIGDRGAAKTH